MKLCKCGLPLSDGYHTMDELYEHRHVLLALACNYMQMYLSDFCIEGGCNMVFKSKLHSDKTMFDEMFIVMGYLNGKQFSYHVEMKYWNLFKIPEHEFADEWDGHTSYDVIDRIKEFIIEIS